MTSFILRRLLQFIPTVIGVTLIVFLLLNLVPGNAALATAGRLELDADVVEQLRKDFELDKPVVVRCANYLAVWRRATWENPCCDVTMWPRWCLAGLGPR